MNTGVAVGIEFNGKSQMQSFIDDTEQSAFAQVVVNEQLNHSIDSESIFKFPAVFVSVFDGIITFKTGFFFLFVIVF